MFLIALFYSLNKNHMLEDINQVSLIEIGTSIDTLSDAIWLFFPRGSL